jgi:hypothetical protein
MAGAPAQEFMRRAGYDTLAARVAAQKTTQRARKAAVPSYAHKEWTLVAALVFIIRRLDSNPVRGGAWQAAVFNPEQATRAVDEAFAQQQSCCCSTAAVVRAALRLPGHGRTSIAETALDALAARASPQQAGFICDGPALAFAIYTPLSTMCYAYTDGRLDEECAPDATAAAEWLAQRGSGAWFVIKCR